MQSARTNANNMKKFTTILLAVAVLIAAFLLFEKYRNGTLVNNASGLEQKSVDINNNEASPKRAVDTNDTSSKADVNYDDIMKGMAAARKAITHHNKFPKSMSDIKMTPELKSALDKEWPDGDGYEEMDYRLRLFDRVAKCLGNSTPASGEISIYLPFDIDLNNKVAVGNDGSSDPDTDYHVRESTIDENLNDKVVSCIKDSQLGLTMDISKDIDFEIRFQQTKTFYSPHRIHFPLSDSFEYTFLAPYYDDSDIKQ